jgi:hypothetical protein
MAVDLWHGEGHVVQAFVTLTNEGPEAVVLDMVVVSEPEGCRVAWLNEKLPGYPLPALENADLTNIHDVLLDVPPGKSYGCAMFVETATTPELGLDLVLDCRIRVGNAEPSWREVRGRVTNVPPHQFA